MKNLSLKIKFILILLGMLAVKTSSFAQSSVTIDASQIYSNFIFTDSEENKGEGYSGNYSGAYSLGYQYSTEGGILLRASIGMRKAGATLVYDDANYNWNLQYANAKLGVGYMYKRDRFSPYIVVSPYYSHLLKANQRINNQDFDIKKSQSIKSMDYGVFASPGVQMTISEAISVYAEFNYMRGLLNIDADENGQKAYNTAYSLTAGVVFAIK